MNEFILSKLGEVLAFARVGADTMENGVGFSRMLQEGDVEDLKRAFNDLEDRIVNLAEGESVLEEVEALAEEPLQKITAMRDTYLQGEWEDESDLLEWMGFYSGAALVHWHLLWGAAEALQFEDLLTLSRDSADFYRSLFVSDEETLHEIGGAMI